MPTPAQRLLQKAHYVPLVGAVLYALILVLTTVPAIQRELVFLHRVRFPFFPNYDNPAFYGIAPFKGRNFKLSTPDGEAIGAWHILPHSVYMDQKPFPPPNTLDDGVFDASFTKRPTVLYLHGNAATRMTPHRIRTYMQLSSNLDCNVVAIDYRGFAESTGTPSQEGLVTDARTAWDWILKRTHASSNIIVMGHSLGTGVASALTAQLADAGQRPRGLALIAPFTSIPDLLSSLWLFGIIPLLTPLKAFPIAQKYFKEAIAFRFNSSEALSRTTAPTLIVHAVDDAIIPPSHSGELFRALIAPNGTALTENVKEIRYKDWGTIRFLERENKGQVVWWEGDYGDHVSVGHSEGTMDLIAWVADL